MSYQSTVNEIRQAANDVNPTGRFDHGRHVDLSQMAEGDYPMIYLYPITIVPDVDPDSVKSTNVLLGFFKQDRPDTTNSERESIISDMDVLSDEFLAVLYDNKKVRVTNKRKEPQYQMYQGTLSGFAVSFTYQNNDDC